MNRFALALLGGAILAMPGFAEELNPKGVTFFEKKIRPVLIEQCYKCHSEESNKVRGGLLVDSRDALLKGGDSGPAIVPGNVRESLLLDALRHGELKMPPKSKLSDAVIADFVKWVAMGAPDPRSDTVTKKTYTRGNADHWSFQPIRRFAPPTSKNAGWARTDIDRFITAKLENEGLQPVADADPLSLLRRISFDLTGLPPTVEEVEAFQKAVAKNRQRAIAELIDRKLASPRFGERWGRHWLDIARYAESNGNADNVPFPEAWRYRDYVIAAFNADKPYDRFLTEQLAGDLLPAKNDKQRDEQLVATGFLALGSKPRAQNNPNFAMDIVADQIEVTCTSLIGLTVACARCHDHKFDPIPTTDYYSLAGIFTSTKTLYGSGGRRNKKNTARGGLHKLKTGGSAMGAGEGKPGDTYVCVRGESNKRGERVERGFISVVAVPQSPAVPKNQSGRLELAQWITSPNHPLTARVMVNRIWHHLFGEGIVRTVDNFGSMGEKPSHPELLDHLASRFIEEGWSVKKLIREVMLSRTYQLSSDHHLGNVAKDSTNHYFWRMNVRRLDAESLRDALLTVSGKLDLKAPTGSTANFTRANKNNPGVARETGHRSVYLAIIRNGTPEVLNVFDFVDASLVVGARDITTVPAQSLYLLNSPFMVEQAKHTAQRILEPASLEEAERIDLAYKLILSRSSTEKERSRALGYLQAMRESLGSSKKAGDTPAWASLCQALMASAEFRYLD